MRAGQTFDELLRAVAHLHRNYRLDEAAEVYRQLVRMKPNDARLFGLFGRLRFDQGRFDEALQLTDKAIRFAPDNALQPFQRAEILEKLGRHGEAADAYRRAIELDPGLSAAFAALVNITLLQCDWRNLDADLAKVTASVKEKRGSVKPYTFLLLSDDPADQLQCAAAFGRGQLRQLAHVMQGSPYTHQPRKREKIRVGYLSADFRNHATTHLLGEVIELHDRSKFEVVAISTGPDRDDPYRKRIAQAFDQFVDALEWPINEFSRRVHALELDILVDLMAHTAMTTTPMLADRPAPIQVNYLGYPGTTGFDFVDYIIVDPFIVSPEDAPHFSEKPVFLPDCYQPNDRKRVVSNQPQRRADHGLPEEGFVFACLNKTNKLMPQMFDVWMRLLVAVPGSVLWLLRGSDNSDGNLRAEAKKRGVDPARLVFAPKVPVPDHLARLQLADLMLDTFPYNSHTTASDALWVGVPLATFAGRSFQARVAGSLLSAVGAPELIAHSFEDYYALCLRLAEDRSRLQEIRERIRANRDGSALFDAPRYTRNLERTYETMFDIWLKGEEPRSFAIDPGKG